MRTERDARSAAAPRAANAPDPLVGRVLEGRYRLTERIARGGMASVYVAHDLRLDRTVAIKVMHPGMGEHDTFAARFVREARAAARLSHPHVVAVYDQGDDDGVVYLAMEYVPGQTLRDIITRHSPMPPAAALARLEPVLSALAAAHQAGLVHRDVKPENVLVGTRPGQVKVADFGLARAVSAETQHTSTGVLIGTVSYIAPELVTEGRADARADVYSAGVLLFELLTGRKPHLGETPIQVAYKHVHTDVPAPSTLVPGIPPYVDALVARATARDRALRPADAGVFAHLAWRVAQALAAGLADDPELTADLRPAARTGSDGTGDSGESAAESTLELAREATREHDLRADELASPAFVTEQLRRIPLADGATDDDAHKDTDGGTGDRRSGGGGDGSMPARGGAGRPRRRRRLALVLLALVVLAGAVTGGWWYTDGRYDRLTGVADLTRADATRRLEADGLSVRVEHAYSDSIAKGSVISSEPGRGAKVLSGDTVTLVVSRGVEEYPLPKVAGLTTDRAQDRLTAVKMDVAPAVERWSETVPAGHVIRSLPKAGTVLRPGHTVTLVVSKGRRPIKVGHWQGEDADHAEATLSKRHLEVRRINRYDDHVAAGLVISQDPTGGTLHRGDTVTLTVSKGPHLVEVPSVRGHGLDSARSELESDGFTVDVRHYTPYFGLGFVMDQDSAGQKLPYGSTITVWIS
ncbi:MAG: Stk1 family PASTA domain-containing Ser/Thr kinase [Nocardioides sp.]|uniref:Stk1 family PASTA domain-containing Ser/Thr kinase n=1 Tax=Nocardioides sp. TaxID=35761 RepID=UPI0039E52712